MPEDTQLVNLSFIRHLARWRAEHLQRAAWQIENNKATWELAPIARYENHDGRTSLRSTSSASPRILRVKSHVNVRIPAIETNVFSWPAETLTLSEQNMRDALLLMMEHDLINAWESYAREPEPIKVWSVIERDGLRPGFRTRIRPQLADATLAFALPSLEWNTGRPWKLEELVGR